MIERYLSLAWDSGSVPFIVLNKIDREPGWSDLIPGIEYAAPGVDCVPVSCVTGDGLDRVRAILKEGKTFAVLGPSGAGKSTLINTLAGEMVADTREVRSSDGKGRHTTKHRELFLLPGGSCLIDTPGHELQLHPPPGQRDGRFSVRRHYQHAVPASRTGKSLYRY